MSVRAGGGAAGELHHLNGRHPTNLLEAAGVDPSWTRQVENESPLRTPPPRAVSGISLGAVDAPTHLPTSNPPLYNLRAHRRIQTRKVAVSLVTTDILSI